MPDTLLLRLAVEELVYLLRALQIGEFPGLEEQPLGKLDADHQALALAVADRALRARRIVQWEGQENRAVDPIAAGLLRDAAHPQYTLLADVSYAGKLPTRYLFTFSKYAAIEYWQPEPGIHQFLAIGDLPEVIAHLRALLLGDENATSAHQSEGGRLLISRARFERLAAITDNAEAARLLAAELPSDIAESLAIAYLAPRRLLHLALWQGIPSEHENRRPVNILTLLKGEQHIFVILNADASDAQLEIIAAAPTRAWHA
ncbi:MAG: hypothetical protein WCD86_03955, partial [Ktedonobacteraceae bacterium]